MQLQLEKLTNTVETLTKAITHLQSDNHQINLLLQKFQQTDQPKSQAQLLATEIRGNPTTVQSTNSAPTLEQPNQPAAPSRTEPKTQAKTYASATKSKASNGRYNPRKAVAQAKKVLENIQPTEDAQQTAISILKGFNPVSRTAIRKPLPAFKRMQRTTAGYDNIQLQEQAAQLAVTQIAGIKRTNISLVKKALSSLQVDPKTLKHMFFSENHKLVVVHHQQATQALEVLGNTPGFTCQRTDSTLLKMEQTIKELAKPLSLPVAVALQLLYSEEEQIHMHALMHPNVDISTSMDVEIPQ
jgi:hypothetical protein